MADYFGIANGFAGIVHLGASLPKFWAGDNLTFRLCGLFKK